MGLGSRGLRTRFGFEVDRDCNTEPSASINPEPYL